MQPLSLTLKGFRGIRNGLGLDTLTLDFERLADGAELIAIAGANGRGGQRHHLGLGHAGHRGEVEVRQALIGDQSRLGTTAFDAAHFTLVHLVLEQRFQQPTSGPAFAIGLLAQVEREPLDRRQPQFGQDQVQSCVHGRTHACTPSKASKPARSGNSTFTLGSTPGSGASSAVAA